MGLTAPALVRYEIVRFFRRRSTFWAITVTAFFLFAILAFGGAILFRTMETEFGLGNFYQYGVGDGMAGVERARYFLLALELSFLAVLAYLLSQRSVADEIEGGSLALLLQTPLSVDRIMLGKLLGLAIVLLVLHSIYMTILYLPIPFMRRAGASVVVEFFFVWLVAVSYLPEGAAGALANIRKGKAYLLFRLSSIARVAILVMILQAAIPQAARARGINVWDVLVSYWNSHIMLYSGEHLGLSTISPMAMVALVLGWQMVSGLLLWMIFVRGRTR